MPSYDLCINCGTEITDPTNLDEETRYVHLETFEVLCHPDDLREMGLSNFEVDEQILGIATYSACPTPPNDDDDGLTTVPGARPTYDEDGNEILDIMTCGTCGRSWNDAAVSSVTPVPAGRCPFEYDHDEDPV